MPRGQFRKEGRKRYGEFQRFIHILKNLREQLTTLGEGSILD